MQAKLPTPKDLKQTRMAHGMSKTDVARKADIHPKTVKRAETDLNIHVTSLQKIIDVLDNESK